ncbi:MAG: MotA/TolQ/ExbB proton channel family protein [Candidatus Eremiobacteraeota bacterium]|nr:MotA/TolQ/ExbB proton channel family protein [Candidatus Eremiobacteraeota bacterium]
MNFLSLWKRLDIAPLVGFALGGLCIAWTLMGEGGKLSAFVSTHAFLVVVGGSFGASLVAIRSQDVASLLRVLPALLGTDSEARQRLATYLIGCARVARNESHLRLEASVDKAEEPALGRGLQLLVDGLGGDFINQVFELEKERERKIYQAAEKFFDSLGGFCPTFGIVGTVMSLVGVLGQLNRPEMLAQGVAEAFIATFYGVLFANMVFLPLAMRVNRIAQDRLETLDMVLVGLLSIERLEHPTLMLERLQVYLGPTRPADE